MNTFSEVHFQKLLRRRHVQKGLTMVVGCAFLALCGCQGAKAQSSKSRQSSRATSDCQSCYRLCDVGGKAQKNSAATDNCKADCDKKCQ